MEFEVRTHHNIIQAPRTALEALQPPSPCVTAIASARGTTFHYARFVKYAWRPRYPCSCFNPTFFGADLRVGVEEIVTDFIKHAVEEISKSFV